MERTSASVLNGAVQAVMLIDVNISLIAVFLVAMLLMTKILLGNFAENVPCACDFFHNMVFYLPEVVTPEPCGVLVHDPKRQIWLIEKLHTTKLQL